MWKYLKFNICGHDINLLERGLKGKETTLEAIAKVYMTYGDKLHQSSGSKYGEKYMLESQSAGAGGFHMCSVLWGSRV